MPRIVAVDVMFFFHASTEPKHSATLRPSPEFASSAAGLFVRLPN